MTSLLVRRLLIDLAEPFARDWNGGDAFRTALFNALSMSFPVGEQFFIDAVRDGRDGAAGGPARSAVRGRGAGLRRPGGDAPATSMRSSTAQLEAQGHVNTWEDRVRWSASSGWKGSTRAMRSPMTAATEHITAIFADWTCSSHPAGAAKAPSRACRRSGMWHAAEESEHRSTAFDVYRALGGNDRLAAALVMRLVTFLLPGRRVPPDAAQPAPRRQPVAAVDLAQRGAFPVRARGAAALHRRPVARLPSRGFSSFPAGRRTRVAVAAGPCRAVPGGRRRGLSLGGRAAVSPAGRSAPAGAAGADPASAQGSPSRLRRRP